MFGLIKNLLSRNRRSSRLRRTARRRFGIERLEDRALLAADFGFAVGIGSPGGDFVNDVAADAAGNAYVVGNFQGTVDFDPGPGTANLTGTGGNDGYVAKYDALGNLVWVRQFSGAGDVRSEQLALDNAGNVHVTGRFFGTVDLDPGAATLNKSSLGQSDVFTVKLNNNGELVWAAQFGGSSFDLNGKVTVDSAGNVFTAGTFNDTPDADLDPGPGFFNPVVNGGGGNDAFITKLDSSGNFVWAVGMGGSASDGPGPLATDAAGNLYTATQFRGTADLDPGSGVANRTSAGSDDFVLQKFDPTGNLVWLSNAIGGTGQDGLNDIALDGASNLVTSGFFANTVDFDPGPGTANLTSAGQFDGFVSKFDNTGNLTWARSLAGVGFELVSNVAIDGTDNIWATGYFAAHFGTTADFDPGPGVFNLTTAGTGDIFVWQLDANGDFVDALSAGGTGFDGGFGIALDGSGNLFIGGSFQNTVDFDSGPGTANLTSAGADDGFLLQLRQNLPPAITSAAAVNLPENQTSVIDVQSIDPEGETEGSGLTYSLTGGADEALFSINPNTGVLTFNVAPDFENPADANTDNVYEVQVTVTDSGLLTGVQNLAVTVTDIDPVGGTSVVIVNTQDLKNSGVLSNGEANPILNHLDQAIMDYNKGKTVKAIQKLEQSRDEIQDLIDDGDLTLAQGQPLIDTINDMIDEILGG